VINLAVELQEGDYDPGLARAQVRAIGATLCAIYDEARGNGVTPLSAAMALAQRNLAI